MNPTPGPPALQLILEPGSISTRVISPTAKYYTEIHLLFRSVLGNEVISMILNLRVLSIAIQLWA